MKTIVSQNKSNLLMRIFVFGVMLWSLNFHGQNKTNQTKKTTDFSLFRVQLSGLPNVLDEFIIYYQEGSTNEFDTEYDAYHLIANSSPHISIDMDSFLLAINGIPPVIQTYTTNVLVTTSTSGNFTISATDIQGLPAGTCVFLKDLQTNATINLLLNSYNFNVSNTATSSKFILTITYNTLPITSDFIQPSCHISSGGKATIEGQSNGPWNYIWKDTTGTIIKTSMGLNTSDSLYNLNTGGYKVEVSSVGNACLRNEIGFNINEVVYPVISFTSPTSIVSSVEKNFYPINLSSNCSSYFWDFGNGVGLSDDFEPSYSYSVSGNYLTKLVGTSNTGCKDSIVKNIQVIDFSTNVVSNSNEKISLADLGNNQFMVKLSLFSVSTLFVNLISLDGKDSFQKNYNVNNNEVLVDLNSLNVGLYLLQVKSNEKELLSTKVYVKQ